MNSPGSPPQPRRRRRSSLLAMQQLFPLSRRLSLTNLTVDLSNEHSTTSQSAPVSPASDTLDSPTSSRRSFSDVLQLFIRGYHQICWWNAKETPETKQLDDMLRNREKRDELVCALLAAHSEFVRPLRFISAYNEYMGVRDKKEKHAMGKRIYAVFFQRGSVHVVQNMPEEDLPYVRVEYFWMIKNYYLEEMLKIPCVSEVLTPQQPS